jgi:hypothetical protein
VIGTPAPIEDLVMLRNFTTLKHMSIGAADGEIGRVRDAYFDDHEWTLRYLVVNPGSWLTARRVLISPWAIRDVSWQGQRVDVALTREQVRNSPGIDSDQPVSRQHEAAYYDYYGYPYYWMGPYAWGAVMIPKEIAQKGSPGEAAQRATGKGDPNLRSANEVAGYHIEAVDGSIGHVEDFIFDDQTWGLRYFVVDTRNWLPGRQVLISTDWIDNVSWEERKAFVALTRDEVRNSPEYDPASFTEAAEDELHHHYHRRLGDRRLGVRVRHERSVGANDWELPI